MSWTSDDLASVMVAPEREFAGWGQGIIKSWDADTFRNTISYRGGEHQDIPVASGLEALTYAPGDVVMLSRWQPTGGGAVSLRIGAGGRVIVPGTGAAEKAIAALRTNLAAQISREITGESVHFDEVATQETRSNSSFGDLATVGPQVTVDVSDVGRALVQFGCVLTSDTTLDHVSMSFAVSGATTQPASGFRAVELQFASAVVMSGASAVLVTGLNPGSNTFTAKYKNVTIGANGFFSARWMIVYPY